MPINMLGPFLWIFLISHTARETKKKTAKIYDLLSCVWYTLVYLSDFIKARTIGSSSFIHNFFVCVNLNEEIYNIYDNV